VSKLPLVVFGCPVANRSWVLDRWWQAIAQQAPLVNYRWKVAFVYTESQDDTLGKLEQMQGWHDVHIIDAGDSPRTRDDMNQHRWPLEHIARMAEWRNLLLDYAKEQEAEWFFSVDSDIVLPPMAFGLLEQQMSGLLLHHGYGAIAPLVNMAGHLDPGTFVYNYMDWVDDGVTSRAYRSGVPMRTETFRADVIMAAMLINRRLFSARWASHDQGEDISWSWNAAQIGLRLAVDPNVVCNHHMRPVA
jgi:hypothetical protein